MTNQQGAPEALRCTLIAAAQAVVDRWDTPLWKDVPATAEYIGRLRAALVEAQQPAPSAAATEPVAVVKWQFGGSKVAHLVGDVEVGDLLYQGAPTPQADSQPAPVRDYPPLPRGWPARFRCDSCDGNGEVGEPISMGHFQPPERARCPDCDGRGWCSEKDAFSADHMRAYADADRAARAPADSVMAPAAYFEEQPDGSVIPVDPSEMGLELVSQPAKAADSVLEDAALTFTSAHIDYVARYGGRCRDCADEYGVCPGSGLPCADSRKAIKHVFDALEYGVKNGFIKSPIATRKQGGAT